MNSLYSQNRTKKPAWQLGALVLTLLCGSVGFIASQNGKLAPSKVAAQPTKKDSPAVDVPALKEPSAHAEISPLSANLVEQIHPVAETLEALAAHDPAKALALALGETDPAVRDERLQTVLRGWASTAPDAAANWTLTQSYLDQGLAMAAVFNSANRNPDAAVNLAQRLTAQHPENSTSYGGYLIFGLAQVGEFERAANFAEASSAEIHTDLFTAAYTYWAKQQPERAVYAALKLDDPAKQNAAFQAAISGWARISPQDLTIAANQFPEGADRTLALTTGLRSWIEKDPAAAADWISRHKLTAKETEMALEE